MDEQKRRLERQLKHESDPKARIKLLGERLRHGEITNQRLALAHFLGSKEASELLGEQPTAQPIPDTAEDVAEWINQVGATAEQASVRSILAAARAVEANVPAGTEIDPAIAAAMDAAEESLVRQGKHNQSDLYELGNEAFRAAERYQEQLYRAEIMGSLDQEFLRPLVQFARIAASAARAAQNGEVERPTSITGPLFESLSGMDAPVFTIYAREQRIIAAELLPWATGDRDPVLERVQAREREQQASEARNQQRWAREEAKKKLDEML